MLSADDMCNRFLAAGKKYGEFDINSINLSEPGTDDFLVAGGVRKGVVAGNDPSRLSRSLDAESA